MGICKYCKSEFDNFIIANHSRWCTQNPKRNEYIDKLNKNRFVPNETSKKLQGEKISNLHKLGIYDFLKEKRTFRGCNHSEESKEKISIARKKWISENRDKFNWNIRKGKSHPCEKLKALLRDKNINFIEEYSPFEERFFSIDIAFPDKMIAIEINGNQHYDKNGELAAYYQERHDFIESKGWKVYEIHHSLVYKDNFMDGINYILDQSNILSDFDYKNWSTISETKRLNRLNESIEKVNKKKEKIELLKQTILDSNINFSKLGWVEKVSKILSNQPQKVNIWMKKNMTEFYEKECFKRKTKRGNSDVGGNPIFSTK